MKRRFLKISMAIARRKESWFYMLLLFLGVNFIVADIRFVKYRFAKREVESELPQTKVTPAARNTTKPIVIDPVRPNSLKVNIEPQGDPIYVKFPNTEIELSADIVYNDTEKKCSTPEEFKWQPLLFPKINNAKAQLPSGKPNHFLITDLSPGDYSYKLQVDCESPPGFAEKVINIVVLAEEKPRRAPIARIIPAEPHIEKNSAIILADASENPDPTDENWKIIAWKWEVVEAPNSFQLDEKEVSESRINLKNLQNHATYCFKLTVTDSNTLQNSTTVTFDTNWQDRPPTAKVSDVEYILDSQNAAILDGSSSSDDDEIVKYQWNRVDNIGDELELMGIDKAQLQVSGFEKPGAYEFKLTVFDASGQNDSTIAHIIVSNHKNLIAEAGHDSTLQAPVKFVVLNGSTSQPLKKLAFKWKQVGGPGPVTLGNTTQPLAAAYKFPEAGRYTFELEVTHVETNEKATDTVDVLVEQGTNSPPIANAGGSRNITLPLPILTINGSSSSDDLAVTRYQWEMGPDSPGGVDIVPQSEKSPLLQLSGVQQGVYTFKLTVYDNQGLNSSDTAVYRIAAPLFAKNQIEMVLDQPVDSISYGDVKEIKNQIWHLVDATPNTSVIIDGVKSDLSTHCTFIIFHLIEILAENKVKYLEGKVVEKTLKQHFYNHKTVLGIAVKRVDTHICQNSCSGHGECDNATKTCVCHALWGANPFRSVFGDGESNCDWSGFYILLTIATICVVIAWIFYFRKTKRVAKIMKAMRPSSPPTRRSSPRSRYSRLLTNANEAQDVFELDGNTILEEESEEEDGEVLFDSRQRSNVKNRGTNHVNGIV